MNRIAALSFVLALAPACATFDASMSARTSPAELSKSRFERIKSLAGEWSGPGPAEMQGAPLDVRYRVTAGGNAVEETIMPGSDHEMVTMYHLDGDRLMLTHYCVAGNQPRMVAANEGSSGGSVETIRFEFAGASNLASPNDGHMHQMEMTIDGKDHLTTHWTYYQDGKTSHEATFELNRK